MKILDCTLRDGGYYTNWDFDKELVRTYCESMEKLPIDYVEVGYRSITLKEYLGKYFYCPEYVMKELKEMMPSKKLVIILNEKDIRASHVPELLAPCKKYISMVRVAVDPNHFKRAIDLAKAVKSMGFEVAFNVMYMSSWKQNTSFLDMLSEVNNNVDYFYMVDSFGGVFPEDVKEIIDLVKLKTKTPLCFHGHDNLHMGLINSITAMENGCQIIDATITGMGRGAGNLRTELLLTYLAKKKNVTFQFDALAKTVAKFEELQAKSKWGTNLPYMFSGAFSLPQKDVMHWIGMNRYPMETIIKALDNKKDYIKDNLQLPTLVTEQNQDSIIILGGGQSVVNTISALKKLLKNNPKYILVHTGTKFIREFEGINNSQYYCLTGYESDKISTLFNSDLMAHKTLVYPPYPRRMGTSIPNNFKKHSYEIFELNFSKVSIDAPLSVAIQLGLDFKVKDFYFIGFDGYETSINQNQFKLAQENQSLLADLAKIKECNLYTLTPTNYNKLNQLSIYSLI